MMIIFISYSSQNRDLVLQLAALLSDMGYEVRYDQQIHAGDEWWKHILADIRACSVVLCALSPEYLDSYPCELEYQYAIALNRPVLPVMIRRVDFGQTPFHVAQIQVLDFTDLTNPKSLTRLVGSLRSLEQQLKPLPSPLPPEPPVPIPRLNAVIDKVTNRAVTLTHDEQKDLLNEIVPFFYKAETQTNARYVLRRFLQRADPGGSPDLFADISSAINYLLKIPEGMTPIPPSNPVIVTPDPVVPPPSDSTPPPGNRIPAWVVIIILVVLSAGLGAAGWAAIHPTLNSTPTQIAQSGTQVATPFVVFTPTQTSAPTQTTVATATPIFPSALTATQAATLAFQTQSVAAITAQFRLNQTATAALWTKTYTPTFTPTQTDTPTDTLTPGATSIPTVTRNNQWTPYIQRSYAVPMVLVPPGCFILGSNNGNSDEKPVGEQCFDKPFWLDEFPVTQVQFNVLGGKATYSPAFISDEHPVENITWFEARDYCVQQRGGRLPTEVEYEYAVRGPDDYVYPWGNDFVGANANVVYSGNSQHSSADIGSRPNGKSWVGALDMVGNVWEWTSSLYQPYPYYANDGRENNNSRGLRTVRGGAWDTAADGIRSSSRNAISPYSWNDDVGFRCARDSQS